MEYFEALPLIINSTGNKLSRVIFSLDVKLSCHIDYNSDVMRFLSWVMDVIIYE